MTPDALGELAHPEVAELWSPLHNVKLERRLWVTVMWHQRKLGLDIPLDAIRRSLRNIAPGPGTLERIDARERITRHDVKARLEIFCEDAGHEYHHLGMTSADVVDNIAQVKMLESMRWVEENLGWRLPAMARYLMRGIKGAVGTQQDQLDLLGSPEACEALDRAVAQRFGFRGVMVSTGQVYPRSQDLEVLSELTAAAVANGSKRPLLALLSGFQAMAAAYAADQWNEGDVSTSVVRRYALRGAFFAVSSDTLRGLDKTAREE